VCIYESIAASLVDTFLAAGITLFPPSDCCLNEGCRDRNKELKTMESRKVVIYTADGAHPGHSIHLICARESYVYPKATDSRHIPGRLWK
jgi:hypothetical protein